MNANEQWTRPLPARTPRPTFWPAGLALGVTVTIWGLVTNMVILGVGAAVAIVSLAGWVREMAREPDEEEGSHDGE